MPSKADDDDDDDDDKCFGKDFKGKILRFIWKVR
jgi:hypothetical protein